MIQLPSGVTDLAAKQKPNPGTGVKSGGLLDSILFAILGPPEQLLTDEDRRAAEAKRREAGSLSKSAAENPGEAFMGIPDSGGGSLGSVVGSILGALGIKGKV